MILHTQRSKEILEWMGDPCKKIAFVYGPESSGKTELVVSVCKQTPYDLQIVDMDDYEEYSIVREYALQNCFFFSKPIVYVFKHYVQQFQKKKLYQVLSQLPEKINKTIFILDIPIFSMNKITMFHIPLPTTDILLELIDRICREHKKTISNQGKNQFLQTYPTPRLINTHVREICHFYQNPTTLNIKHVKKYIQTHNIDKDIDIKKDIKDMLQGIPGNMCLQMPNWIFYNLDSSSLEKHFEVVDQLSESNEIYNRVVKKFDYDMYDIANYICNKSLCVTDKEIRELRYPNTRVCKFTFSLDQPYQQSI